MTQIFSKSSKSSPSKLTFIHVRKNAGTSLIEYLQGLDADIEIAYDFVRRSDRVVFGVARNPYDRCLSSWKYCHSTKNRPLLDVLANPPKRTDTDSGNPHHTPGHDYRHFTRTQSSFLFDVNHGPDKILRFEHLFDDLQDFLDRYNVETFGRPLPHLNANPHPSVETLTDEERWAIHRFYKEDFDNLGYKP